MKNFLKFSCDPTVNYLKSNLVQTVTDIKKEKRRVQREKLTNWIMKCLFDYNDKFA